MERRVWETEMTLRDLVQALEDSARAYNSVAEDIKIVPNTAKYAKGRNLAIKVDIRAKKRDEMLKSDIRGDILPVLQVLYCTRNTIKYYVILCAFHSILFYIQVFYRFKNNAL